MAPMTVTLEVSQLEMSALKSSRPLKRSFMSVMPETSHPAMGPYVASAVSASVLKAATAVISSSLLVNLKGGGKGGGGVGGGGEGEGGGGGGGDDGGGDGEGGEGAGGNEGGAGGGDGGGVKFS
jgi:hypothetical protein